MRKRRTFRSPGLTAITANLWHDFISLPLAYTGGEDEVGRLRNVLNRAVAEATHFGNSTNILIEFQVALSPIGPDGGDSDLVTRHLWMYYGRDENGGAVWTIMTARDF